MPFGKDERTYKKMVDRIECFEHLQQIAPSCKDTKEIIGKIRFSYKKNVFDKHNFDQIFKGVNLNETYIFGYISCFNENTD